MVSYRIEWNTPKTPSCQNKDLFDTMPFRLGIIAEKDGSTHIKPNDFICDLWTDLYHKTYNEGEWHPVPMEYMGVRMDMDNNHVCYTYGVDLTLTCLGSYSFTYRARHKFEKGSEEEWAEKFKVDGHVGVRQPVKDYTTWVQEPHENQITHNIYIGNYQAAMVAPENGFDCLLNTADDAPVFPEQLLHPIIYRRCPLPAGANNVIGEEMIRDSVQWLRAMSDRCKKILVHSRAGFGRAGSILIAFVFAHNPNLNFEQACQFVDRRHFVYNHRGLKNTLYKLYPRE